MPLVVYSLEGRQTQTHARLHVYQCFSQNQTRRMLAFGRHATGLLKVLSNESVLKDDCWFFVTV